MQRVSLFADRGLRRVLALGAHCDDIEIGCGGRLGGLGGEGPGLEVRWVVFCSTPERAVEARASAAAFLEGVHTSTVAVHTFRDGYLPHSGAAVKDEFEAQKRAWSPELILTHYRNDLHQDHRLVSHLTWNTWRNHLILEYEIVKYDGDLGAPNLFVPLSESIARKKIRTIMECFKSQKGKNWFTEDVFSS